MTPKSRPLTREIMGTASLSLITQQHDTVVRTSSVALVSLTAMLVWRVLLSLLVEQTYYYVTTEGIFGAKRESFSDQSQR